MFLQLTSVGDTGNGVYKTTHKILFRTQSLVLQVEKHESCF